MVVDIDKKVPNFCIEIIFSYFEELMIRMVILFFSRISEFFKHAGIMGPIFLYTDE